MKCTGRMGKRGKVRNLRGSENGIGSAIETVRDKEGDRQKKG